MPKCKVCNENALYGPLGEKGSYCHAHKLPNMYHIYSKKCKFLDCPRRPTFGYEKGTALYCKFHKAPDMEDVKNVKCSQDGCKRQPVFNFAGEKPKFCAEHMIFGMEDVKNPKCKKQGCPSQPAYGFVGEKAQFCAKHLLPGMIDVKNIHCHKCSRIASFGFEDGKPVSCIEHIDHGMINLKIPKCEFEGCPSAPSYGFHKGKPTHCSKHQLPNMRDVAHLKCEDPECEQNRTYGFEGEVARFCLIHAPSGTINVARKSCDTEGCPAKAYYNYVGLSPLYCRTCAKPNMILIHSDRCILCPTFASVSKYRGYCMRCFIHTFPDEKVSRNFKVKERHVNDFLENEYQDVEFSHDKSVGGCSRRRPDWFFECFTHSIIVECDENQHQDYETTCEIQRINELYTDLAYRPIVFIRFNPDDYIDVMGNKIKSSFKQHRKLDVPVIRNKSEWDMRLQSLKEKIDYHRNNIPAEPMEIDTLFFDA